MKNRTLFIIVALLTSMLSGCSKHSPPAPKVADLGVVEVTDGGTNRVTASDGKVFIVRSIILKDQKVTINGQETVLKGEKIGLMISTEQTDAHGVIQLSPAQNIMDRKSTRLNSSHANISYAVFCLKK